MLGLACQTAISTTVAFQPSTSSTLIYWLKNKSKQYYHNVHYSYGGKTTTTKRYFLLDRTRHCRIRGPFHRGQPKCMSSSRWSTLSLTRSTVIHAVPISSENDSSLILKAPLWAQFSNTPTQLFSFRFLCGSKSDHFGRKGCKKMLAVCTDLQEASTQLRFQNIDRIYQTGRGNGVCVCVCGGGGQ